VFDSVQVVFVNTDNIIDLPTSEFIKYLLVLIPIVIIFLESKLQAAFIFSLVQNYQYSTDAL
jgi:hypothetical protein